MAARGRFTTTLIVGLLLGSTSAWVSARVIYVDDDAPGANNGSSWTNAYRYLQDALATATAGDVIKVGQGVYKPHLRTAPGPTDRSVTFTLKSAVTLLGGYAGYGAPQPDQRDPSVYKSILSGDRNGDDWVLDPADHTAVGLLLTDSTRQDNCYNVVTATSVDSTAVLDGFVITGGIANGPTAKRGGGILCNQASPTIRNCVISGCAASERGGAILVNTGGPNLTSCTITGNYASERAGGIFSLAADPNILQCTLSHNLVAQQGKGGAIANEESYSLITSTILQKNYGGSEGGAIHNLRGRPVIRDCTFIDNTSRLTGGAIENSNDTFATITRCSFIGNSTGQAGGAISNWAGTCRALHCIFVGNRSNDEAGAIYIHESDPNIINCLFNGNSAANYGGAITCSASTVNVINCTFSSNNAVGGKAVACSSTSPPGTASSLVIVNSILWDGGSEIYNNDGSQIRATYSDIEAWWPGAGNTSANPMFTDRDGPDNVLGNQDDILTLSAGSPCIDAGDNTVLPIDLLSDLAGKARRFDDPATTDAGKGQAPIVDMGVYEFGSQVPGQNPPVANAGPDRTVTADQTGYANVQLDGSGSYDVDGDPLTYSWTWTIGAQTYHASGVAPTIQLPVGTHTIYLTVFDGTLYSSPDSVRITVRSGVNQPPVANAGPDRTVTAGPGGYATVQLDGSGSYDPEGSPLTYLWTWTIGTQTYNASGVMPTIQLPVGTYTIRLRVHDGTQYSPEDTVVITVLQVPQYQMWLWPFQVNRTDTTRYVIAIIRLPEVGLLDLDMSVPIVIQPYWIDAIAQDASEFTDGGLVTYVYAVFWEDDILNTIPQDGLVQLTIQGQMASGQIYQATGQVVLTH
ncbi:MAG: PKD domain-containing protein [Sedimentisphaerales bacterium]|nr:PKD domain-containing protein [Sedimentisphaerales bacterium]